MDPKAYIAENGLSVAAWARRIGVKRQTAHRYLLGRIPEPEVMDRIETDSGGALTANDFYRVRRKLQADETEAGEVQP